MKDHQPICSPQKKISRRKKNRVPFIEERTQKAFEESDVWGKSGGSIKPNCNNSAERQRPQKREGSERKGIRIKGHHLKRRKKHFAGGAKKNGKSS